MIAKIKEKLLHWDVMLLIGTVVISGFITWYITGNILDSDAASEMVLAHHLFETKQFLSKDWIYSTEIRILYMWNFFTPLFYILDDWHKIRFVGTMMMQLFMIATYIYLMKSINTDRRIINLGAILLLLPLNVAYGRVVLYHCHYIIYISFTFLLLAMIIRLYKKSIKNKRTTIAILAIISFGCGLTGIRYFLMLYVPLFLLIFTTGYIKDQDKNHQSIISKEYQKFIKYFSVSGVFAFSGLIVNRMIMTKNYKFHAHLEYMLSLIDFNKLQEIISALLYQFGFRNYVHMMSFVGLLSVFGAIICIYITIVSIKKLLKTKCESDIGKMVIEFFYLFSLITILCIFIFTGVDGYYYYPLYLVPVFVWIIPFITMNLYEIYIKFSKYNLNRFVVIVCVLVMIANGGGK